MDDGNLFLFDNSRGKYGVANENGEWIVEPAYMEFDFQYRDKGIIIVEADDFYDSNHLTDKGAIKFTKILNKDICQ